MVDGLIKRQTSLSGNIVLLCRFLRNKGFNLTTSEEEDVMRALSIISPTAESAYKAVLKAILCKNRHQVINFNDLYIEYSEQVKKAVDSKIKNQETASGT